MNNIDKDIPIPPRFDKLGFFHRFNVGDSMFFENCDHQSPIAQRARKMNMRTDKRFTARREGNGLRIWRVE